MHTLQTVATAENVRTALSYLAGVILKAMSFPMCWAWPRAVFRAGMVQVSWPSVHSILCGSR